MQLGRRRPVLHFDRESGGRTCWGEPGRGRTGFTLFELLLVLAVLVLLAGISWPRLMRFISEQRIQESSEAVRRELDRTRVHAIDAGLTYQFRYEPGGRNFVILPYDRPDTAGASGGLESTSVVTLPAIHGELAEECRFGLESQPGGGLEAEKLNEAWLGLLPESGGMLDQVNWAPPILFYEDGRGTDAELLIEDTDRRLIRVTVRGLTGAASRGALERMDSFGNLGQVGG